MRARCLVLQLGEWEEVEAEARVSGAGWLRSPKIKKYKIKYQKLSISTCDRHDDCSHSINVI